MDLRLDQPDAALQKLRGDFGGVVQPFGFQVERSEQRPVYEFERRVEVAAAGAMEPVAQGAAGPGTEAGERAVFLGGAHADDGEPAVPFEGSHEGFETGDGELA